MFCNQCGRSVVEGSRFCPACGATLLPESRVATLEPEAEETLFVLRPTLIFVTMWYIVAALLVLATAALVGLLSPKMAGSTAFIVILAVSLVAFAIPVSKHILRMREVYTLTNHKLEMRFGLIAKTIRNIPLRNVQDVTVTSKVWERLMGLGDIVIDSASESGKITLSDIRRPDHYADQILSQLRRLR